MILTLTNFRNFQTKTVDLTKDNIVILANNATGKTNILESIYLLATGKSFRAQKELEMINWHQDFAIVTAKINSNLTLEVVLPKNGYKKLKVNNLGKHLIDFAANLKAVLFRPHDMELFSGSPAHRRKFMDSVLTISDREYHRCLLSYEKGLRSRNRLLKQIRDQKGTPDQLFFWNSLLIKNGDYLSTKRQELIDFINSSDQLNHKQLTINYLKNPISESRLQKYSQEEVFAAQTLVGPHRDDFEVYQDGNNIAKFASRAEERLAILWLKIAELNYIFQLTNQKPLLLLDDIFSELDHDHRHIIFKIMKDYKTIITTADPDFLTPNLGVEIIKL